MARPIKLRDFIAALRAADGKIEFLENRGKGSHLMLCRADPEGVKSFPLPTSSGEVVGPYQKKVIELYGLPDDVFSKRGKKSRK